ncbi:MAG: hypothetical protein NXI10_05685 [bacterium]|nr:hypothetical protein [bacterium]
MKTNTNAHLCGAPTRRVRSMNALFLTAFLFLTVSFAGLGQDLDDFKYAASQDGIKSIPYSSMRSKAGTLQGEKDRAFSACAGFKGRQLHDSKKNSLRIQKEMKEDLEDAREKLEDDDGSSSSTTNSLKSKVKELEEELKDITEEIEEMDEKIDDGLEAWKALLEKRLEINEHFQEVKKKLAQSKSYPDRHIDKPSSSDTEAMEEYDEDVKKLKEYIDDIEDTIDDGTYKHRTPIEEAKKAIQWLEDAKKLR